MIETTRVAYFERFDIEIPVEAIGDCSHQGACDKDVDFWQRSGEIDFSEISDSDLVEELTDTGGADLWDLSDRDDNEQRILWIACCDLKEEETTRD